MTIPLTMESLSDKQRYIMFNISLSMNTEHDDYETYKDAMADRESLIKDAISSAVSAHTELECRNDMDSLKADILKAIQDLFQSDFIYKIAISDVKFG
jgi:flagellar FliL protein